MALPATVQMESGLRGAARPKDGDFLERRHPALLGSALVALDAQLNRLSPAAGDLIMVVDGEGPRTMSRVEASLSGAEQAASETLCVLSVQDGIHTQLEALITIWERYRKPAARDERQRELIELVASRLPPLVRRVSAHGGEVGFPCFATRATLEELMLLHDLASFTSRSILKGATDAALDSAFSSSPEPSTARLMAPVVRSSLLVAKCLRKIRDKAGAQAKAKFENALL